MTETPLRSITNSGTYMLILVPIYSMKIFISQTFMTTYVVSFVCRYVTCPRFDHRYLHISLPVSLFTRSVIHHLVTNSLVTFLASFLWCCINERAQRYLSIIWNDKSQSWSMPTQQTPSEIPVEHIYDHPLTLWHLIAHKVFLSIWELHDLMVEGICIWYLRKQ